MYGVEKDFWLNMINLIGILIILLYFFNKIMTKILKVNKRLFSRQDFINETHRIIYRVVNIISASLLLVATHMMLTSESHYNYITLAYITTFLSLSTLYINELVTIYMEKKYAKNKRDWLYSLSELLFLTALFTTFMLCVHFEII